MFKFSSSFKLNEIRKVDSPFNEDPKNVIFFQVGSNFGSSIYRTRSSIIRAFLRLFRAFVRASWPNTYAAKIGVWIGYVHRTKLITEIFCIVYRQKRIV